MKHTAIWSVIGTTALVTTLAACGSPSEQASGGEDAITVGATAVPHAEILEFVRDELAADAGLDIEIQEFTDYNQPNAALVQGELDANYFQHRPFLEEYLANNEDADLTYLDDVHLEAFGLYSDALGGVDDLGEGATIAVPNDGSNLGRALQLLQAQGLITLEEGAGDGATENDIADNPEGLEITPIEAAQLPRSLADVDAAVVNGNFALEANLAEEANTLALEDTEDNPYANGLVVDSADVDDEDLNKLDELLHSDEVGDFVEERWQGVVIPIEAGAAGQE
ncbi:D-methionine transport system substrate-binding protein [Spinactinospora alkalitolerans]|uniref:Lipoprotein n=1 Tax=Spinactinospora alkalitolerans TaxID=687207 RepID=A0A852U4L1_9ACTN|nr:MetQ/NlpA family ABC transporter substrate-binding protein [Spinactinospora alkalitolerans]NYE48890.1 D-methionine transport system substrate-binding protein [Spinactinospora alkalitolerans]